jgi:gluconokinase
MCEDPRVGGLSSKPMNVTAFSLVVMGVSGCGKSTLAQAVAQALGCTMLEGDAFHADASQTKMSQGTPLTDADRAGWLATLGEQLLLQSAQNPRGAVLSCSALKQAYRDTLRRYVPPVRFIFLQISPATALARVSARAGEHFFPAALVDDQFATLESPTGEPGVLTLDASNPQADQLAQVLAWLG